MKDIDAVIVWIKSRRDMWEQAAQNGDDLAMITTWQLVGDLDYILEMLEEVQCPNQQNESDVPD